MPHPLSHKYPIPISQLCLVNTDVPAGVGAPPTVRRKKGDGSVINVTCPQLVVDFNAHMGGIDLGDQ